MNRRITRPIYLLTASLLLMLAVAPRMLQAATPSAEQELRSMTNAEGKHYPEHTIKTHIGHSAQFIRWLAGEWQPQGPRRR